MDGGKDSVSERVHFWVVANVEDTESLTSVVFLTVKDFIPLADVSYLIYLLQPENTESPWIR